MRFRNWSQVVLIEDWRNGGFGVYVHWPFCEAKCPYCDFNSHVSRSIDQARWLEAYKRQVERYSAALPGRVVNSIFFGGGTPSLMKPEIVEGVIEKIRQCWPTANDLEVTLEANPSSVEANRFLGYRDAGISRISMGIQALNDRDLKRLGRIHSVAEARSAFAVARSVFERVSFDLIYSRQDQSLREWKSELKIALDMAADHISLYQLTIEDGTAFGDRYKAGKLKGLPDEDSAADMYLETQDICATAGFRGYEISSHALPGSESRHNLVYWRYGDYVGVGPGAHGRLTIDGKRLATQEWSNPSKWLDLAMQSGAEMSRYTLSGPEQALEYILMSLRLLEGADLNRYEAMAGEPLSVKAISELVEMNLITNESGRIRTTAQGRPLLNSVLAHLVSS